MRVGVLSLQGDVAEHSRVLSELGVEVTAVRRSGDLSGIDAMVLPGGESTTMSMLLTSSGLFEPLAGALDGGLPVFGTCAGLILLASDVRDGRFDQRCFGAIPAVVRRNGYGRQLQSFECDLEVTGIDGGPVPGVFIRAPRIDSVGPGVEVLACLPPATGRHSGGAGGQGPGEGDGSAAVGTPVLCRYGTVLVAAFHPELTGDTRVHQLFLAMVGGNRQVAVTEDGARGTPPVPARAG